MDSSSSSFLSQTSSPDIQLQFYSCPTSPTMGTEFDLKHASYKTDDDDDDDDDFEFEFETSHRFADGWRSQSSPTFDCCPVDDEQQANSFSAMAFADQLFSNGHFLPLKLPPRLVHKNKNGTNSSVPTSPKSPLRNRIPFSRRCSTWNDNFDPFMVALDNVRASRKSVHRRTRSLSPFRTITLIDDSDANSKIEMVKEAKGSAYARWVRSQTMGHKRSSSVIGASSKSLTKAKRTSLFGSKRGTSENSQVGFSAAESKMQKVKSILVKFTSFRKENNPSIATAAAAPMRKPGNFFKKLSFKFKGGNEKKKIAGASSATSGGGESKIMTLVKYNPKLPLCLGYVPASPNRLQN